MSLVIVVLVLLGALVVDIGMQRVARADMQALADVVALDLSRELDGRSAAELESVMVAAAAASLARNADVIGDEVPDLDPVLGTMQPGASGDTFVPVDGAAVPTAVRVRAETSVSFAFAGATGVESGGAQRDATSAAASTACYRLGSFVAAVNSDDSTVLAPLNAILGVNLRLVDYRALAAVDVRLGDLAASPHIGSPEQLLAAPVSYAGLVRAMIDVLDNDPATANSVAVAALGVILRTAGDVGPVSLADVLHVAPTDTAALSVALKLLDILGTARLATGQHFLEVPNLMAGVAGLGSQFTGSLSIISAAELACGTPNSEQTIAENAQIKGALGLNFVNLPSLNLGIGTLQTAKGSGSLTIDVGQGTGQLVSPPAVHCGDGTVNDPHRFAVRVTTGLASYGLSMNVVAAGDLQSSVLEQLGLKSLLDRLLGGLLGGRKVGVEIGVSLSVATTEQPTSTTVELSLPPNDVVPVETGSSVYLDPSKLVATVTSVKLGGTTVTDLALVKALTDLVVAELTYVGRDFVERTVAPFLENLDQMLIGPVARMVGLRFAGADVYAAGAACGLPRLVE